MAAPIILTTYDWVPKGPRGFVRDLRVRWALEEAGLAYAVRTTPFENRGAEHFERQPFGQVPFIDDDGIRVFESGAILLHLGKKSETLMPRDPQGEADTTQWVIAALNSIEMVSVPWWFIRAPDKDDNPLEGWLRDRFKRLDAVLSGRQWLAASRFTIADLLMADVLRVPRKLGALDGFASLISYVERVTARPAFLKAVDDQMAHFAAGDQHRTRTP
ncbi:glutathione S-transferase family protein [Pelagibacterium lacus]|uniref:Glutathione S-transferase family protein n=1 Tax=Pelagibacterium lacus TaxID=2282655 RepID=A0A369W6E8_9HYPH|nr:glutathione S-transferase family protein [Pelagibacterium lacus]RDE08920.1 glutathione S-transferase family protein [Pelagibacterium lacus]